MKPRTRLLLGLLIWLSLILAGCGSSNQGNSSGSTGNNSSQDSANLSQVNMLLVGTLKLEDTEKAVTKDEASQLLTLWQAYSTLSTSQTAAEAEVEGLLKQIESTMTADQVQAIKDMNLTSTDMMALMQTLGVAMGARGTPNPQATPGASFPGGMIMQGNPPDDAEGGPPDGSTGGTTRSFRHGGPPGGGLVIGGDAGSSAGLGGGQMLQGTPDPSMQATAQARFSTQASQVNIMLLEVLINKLEAKAAG